MAIITYLTENCKQAMIRSFLVTLLAIVPESSEQFWDITPTVRPLPRSTMKSCDDYNDVIGWVTYQMEINGKLKSFQQNLGTLQQNLNEKSSLKNCCFYENKTMDKIMDDINKISGANGNQIGEPLKASGDMGKDLDNILPRVKQVVAKGFKSCCENLQELLKKLEEDLKRQLEDLKRKLDSSTGSSKDKEDLEKKLKDLEDLLKDLKDRLEKLDKKLAENSHSEQKCCAELDSKIRDLENQIKQMKNQSDDKAKDLENQLKGFKDKQQDQENQMKDLKKTVENRMEKVKDLTEKCEKSCDRGNNDYLSDLEARFDQLDKLMKNVSKNIDNNHLGASDPNMVAKIKICEENAKSLQIIEALLKNLTNSRCDKNNDENCLQLNNRIKDMEQQKKDLDEKLEKSISCCKEIGELREKTTRLKIELQITTEKYEKHISGSDADYNKLRDQLMNKLAELEALIKKKEQEKPTQNDKDLDQKIRTLQIEVTKIQETLKDIKNHLNDFSNLNKNQSDTMRIMFNKLTEELLQLKQKSGELETKIVLRVEDLENKLLNNTFSSNIANDRLQRMENLYESLRQDLDKAQKKFQILSNLDQMAKDAQSRLLKLEEPVNNCRGKCSQIEKMDDLIDKIEDLEKIAKIPSRKRPVTSNGKGKMIKTTKTTKKNVNSWVGGIDYVTSKTETNKSWNSIS
ncbi:probable DNA double-strand break repair Rad50 ATPase [Drosophila ananassae]|uniref:probable DNA double-strand break repair Rad50 ATPase n=1 Tax=Drosophila ananassae TaxID=7217 RepID=UPI0013A5C87A|nr:probable DNA double-strand break repair Rad50 ATPase [Drosophila ananassae]